MKRFSIQGLKGHNLIDASIGFDDNVVPKAGVSGLVGMERAVGISAGTPPRLAAQFDHLADMPGGTAVFDSGAGTITAGGNAAFQNQSSVSDIAVGNLILLALGVSDAQAAGLYRVTTLGSGSAPFVLTRDASYNSTGDFSSGQYFVPTEGDAAGLPIFVNIGNGFTLNTSPLQLSPTNVIELLSQGGGGGGGGGGAAIVFLGNTDALSHYDDATGESELLYDGGALTLTGASNGLLNSSDLATRSGTTSYMVGSRIAVVFKSMSNPGSSHPYAPNSGIYEVTSLGSGGAPFVLTRVSYFNSAPKVVPGSYTIIGGGTHGGALLIVQGLGGSTFDTDPINFTAIADPSTITLPPQMSQMICGSNIAAVLDGTDALDFTYNASSKTLSGVGNGSVNASVIATKGGRSDSIVGTTIMLVFNSGSDPGSSHPYSPQSGPYDVTTLGDGSSPFVLTRNSAFDSDTDIGITGRFVQVSSGFYAGGLFVFAGRTGPTLDTSQLFFAIAGVPTLDGNSLESVSGILRVKLAGGSAVTETGGLDVQNADATHRGVMSAAMYLALTAVAAEVSHDIDDTTSGTASVDSAQFNVPVNTQWNVGIHIKAKSTTDPTKAANLVYLSGIRRGASGDPTTIGDPPVLVATLADSGGIGGITAALAPVTDSSGNVYVHITGVAGHDISYDVTVVLS